LIQRRRRKHARTGRALIKEEVEEHLLARKRLEREREREKDELTQ
jgi:hypothetical protein